MDRRPLKLAELLFPLSLCSNAAGAADLLGLYAGGAVGQASDGNPELFSLGLTWSF
jgi:hypothetical protein